METRKIGGNARDFGAQGCWRCEELREEDGVQLTEKRVDQR